MTQERPDLTLSREIDSNLRKVYEDVLNEEVPDRFKELLNQLRSEDGAVGDTRGEGS